MLLPHKARLFLIVLVNLNMAQLTSTTEYKQTLWHHSIADVSLQTHKIK